MLVPINQLDQYGVVKDIEDFLLASNAFTDARNVRFADGNIRSVGKESGIFSPTGIVPYWNLHTFAADGEGVWLWAGLAKVSARIGSSNVDITRASADYHGTADNIWTGGVLGGIPILNNGVDLPQRWAPITSGTKLVDLDNWPTTWLCQAMRPFKNFLIAMNISESGVNYIHRVRWSHPAVPGAVPISWDALDPKVDAGRFDLPDVFSGKIVDGATLRDVFILGKEKALWGMQYVGGVDKFRVFPISTTTGFMSRNCATPAPEGTLIFFASGDDVMVSDGLKVTSVLEKRERKWVQSNISSAFFNRSFCVTDETNHECWFCFPTGGAQWPTLGLVWNKQTNTVSFRDLPQLSYASPGLVSATSSPWSADTLPWSRDTGRWTELVHQPFLRPLVGTSPATSEMLLLEVSENVPISFIERTGWSIIGMDGAGNPISDMTRRKLVKRIYLEGRGGTVNVKVGVQAKLGGIIDWSIPRTFNMNSSIAADFHTQGVLWGMRIDSAEAFSLSRIVADVEDVGSAF